MKRTVLLALFVVLVSAVLMAQQTPAASTDKIVLSAGTKIPLVLKQGISTKNAHAGDPVYAATNFPITLNDHIVIPAGSYVQGVIDEVRRAGKVKGRAEVLVHFRTLIFPNGYTVMFPGSVEGAPDSDNAQVKPGDKEGTVQREGEKGKDAGTIAKTAGTGAVIGGAAARSVKGVGIGGLAGAAAGTVYTLFTRGSDLKLPSGTTIDMVLDRPLTLDQSKLRASVQ
jgi:hypothetical protein